MPSLMIPLEASLRDRITFRRDGAPNPDGQCVVYWMQHAQRAVDNPALEVAIAAANQLQKPVVVFLGLIPNYPNANLRHYKFLVDGLPRLASQLHERGIGFVFRRYPDHPVEKFCEEVRPSLVIGDENPLREPERWRRELTQRLPIPLWTVDADVVVPTRLFGKEHYAARTIRPKIHAQLVQYLRRTHETAVHVRWRPVQGLLSLSPRDNVMDGFPIDRSVQPVAHLSGGTTQGLKRLSEFLHHDLAGYSTRRNHPETDGTSCLSPYLHFGQISPIALALAVKDSKAPKVDRDAFLEQLIVRRELAVNFVHYNPKYDRLSSCEPWAIRSLKKHASDPRNPRYSERQMENAETHDPLWNAAQEQMVTTGWMHGYLRMYWAKKILEWTKTPTEAYAIAVRLNDRYELDGRDPNGYAGIAWAIGGKHDRAWGPERPIFGLIRYMSYASTSRKFDSRAYINMVTSQNQGEEKGGKIK